MSSFISQNLTKIETVTGCTFACICHNVFGMFSCLQVNWQPFCLRQLLKFHPFDWLIEIYLQTKGQGTHHKMVSLQPMPSFPPLLYKIVISDQKWPTKLIKINKIIELVKGVKIVHFYSQTSSTLLFYACLGNSTNGCQRIFRNPLLKWNFNEHSFSRKLNLHCRFGQCENRGLRLVYTVRFVVANRRLRKRWWNRCGLTFMLFIP